MKPVKFDIIRQKQRYQVADLRKDRAQITQDGVGEIILERAEDEPLLVAIFREIWSKFSGSASMITSLETWNRGIGPMYNALKNGPAAALDPDPGWIRAKLDMARIRNKNTTIWAFLRRN